MPSDKKKFCRNEATFVLKVCLCFNVVLLYICVQPTNNFNRCMKLLYCWLLQTVCRVFKFCSFYKKVTSKSVLVRSILHNVFLLVRNVSQGTVVALSCCEFQLFKLQLQTQGFHTTFVKKSFLSPCERSEQESSKFKRKKKSASPVCGVELNPRHQ